jgi:nitrogen-specific signal transduction histidine kinase
LLLNACEAAPAVGGRVEVAVNENGGAIEIEVSDNGPGVADSIRDKLFHPFVSYGKENGTGLGLAVVQKIVQDHRGEIAVERTPNARTVFRIVLPGRSREALAATHPSPIPSFVRTKHDGDDPDSISASRQSGR